MANFITGILEENDDGAVYEGMTFDRFLLLRHSSGQVLSIFDGFDQISEGLSVGFVYEVILCPLVAPKSLKQAQMVELELDDTTSGKVITLDWKSEAGYFKRSIPSLDSEIWILVSTSLGQIILSPNDIEGELRGRIKAGDFISWENMRWDLCAISLNAF